MTSARRARDAEAVQRAKADNQRDKAIAAEARTRTIDSFLTNDLLTQAEPPNNAVGDKVTLLEVLDRAAEKVGTRFTNRPELEEYLRWTIANIYHSLASWDKAESQTRSLLDSARKLDPRSAETYKYQGFLAHILWHRGRRDAEVLEMAETAVKGLQRTRGPDDLDTQSAINNLALAYDSAGRLPEAIALLERVRDVSIAKLGPDPINTLIVLANFAAFYKEANQLDKSVPLFEDVLKRREAKLGRQDLATQRTAATLGVAYKDVGRLKDAIPLLEDVYQSAKRFPELRWVDDPLIDAYQKAGENAKLADLLQEQLPEARKALPKDSPQLAGRLAQTGMTFLQLKKWTEADPLLRECLTIREKTQPDVWSTFNTQSLLGAALLGQKKYGEAEPLLWKGFEGMKQREKTIPPPAITRLPEAIDRLVELFTATDKPNEVKTWQAERAKYPAAQAPPPGEKK